MGRTQRVKVGDNLSFRWALPVSTEKSTLVFFSRSFELAGENNVRLYHQMVSTASSVVDVGVTLNQI
jgi:hypothetical protein